MRRAWRFPPFSAEVADGQLWGRGACDMKGGLAAAVAAALRFVARGDVPGSISFLVTGDEEGPSVNGTAKLLDWALAKGEAFDHCIVGEPTSVERLGDTIKNGRRGSLTGRLTLRGRQGHVAYPQIADNPLRRLAPLLVALFEPPLDSGSADFDPSNLEVVTVDVGNPATNVIPGAVRLVFNVRFNDRWTPETLMAEIERRVALAAGDAKTTLTFDPTNAVSFLDRARRLHRSRRGGGRGRHRPPAAIVDQRRHVGRALHQERLPGRRSRTAERHDSRRRRARGARRSRRPDPHLRAGARALFRLSPPARGRAERVRGFAP